MDEFAHLQTEVQMNQIIVLSLQIRQISLLLAHLKLQLPCQYKKTYSNAPNEFNVFITNHHGGNPHTN